MICELKLTGDMLTALLSGEIDHHSVKSVREEIDSSIDINRPKTLFMDFKKITFMDSSGIGLVMGRYRKMQLYGGKIVILSPPKSIEKVMRLSGIDKLAKIDLQN